MISRAAWGAKPRTRLRVPRPLSMVDTLYVHRTDSDSPADHNRCAQAVRNTQAYHQGRAKPPPLPDLAYNEVVCGHGVSFEGADPELAQFHTKNGNRRGLAIVLLTREGYTPAQMLQLYNGVARWERRVGRPLNVLPHSAATTTSCPGDTIRALLAKGRLTFEEFDMDEATLRRVVTQTAAAAAAETYKLMLPEIGKYIRDSAVEAHDIAAIADAVAAKLAVKA